MTKAKKYFGVLIAAAFILGCTTALWAAEKKVNINTATVEELAKLQRVGPKLAADIVEYRRNNGPFRTIDELKNVKGVGDKVFELNKDAITVGEAKPPQK